MQPVTEKGGVDWLGLEHLRPMFGQLSSNDIRRGTIFPRLELNGANGVARPRAEAADGAQDVMATRGATKVCVTLFRDLDVPKLLKDILLGQLSGMILERLKASRESGVGVGGINKSRDVRILQGLATSLASVYTLDGANASKHAVKFIFRGGGLMVEPLRDHVSRDSVHGTLEKDKASCWVSEVLRENGDGVKLPSNPRRPVRVIEDIRIDTVGRSRGRVRLVMTTGLGRGATAIEGKRRMKGEVLLPTENAAPKLVIKLLRRVMVSVDPIHE